MNRILLVANYYPEDWDEELIDSDIQKMKECGFNVVRIYGFAQNLFVVIHQDGRGGAVGVVGVGLKLRA